MKNLRLSYEKFANPNGGCGDKGNFHSYIDFYQKTFLKYKNVNFLEIGVMRGHSAMMWADYFEDSSIYCVDIKKNLDFEENGWTFVLADATRANFAAAIREDSFDYIIDDGSHILEDQILSFFFLFPKLKSGGKYIIEDVQNIDADNIFFRRLHKSCEIVDLRHERPLKDNVLICYTKD